MLNTRIFSTGIILLISITSSFAAYIDGIWQVNRSNDLVEIKATNYGLKAKFLNSNDWIHYDRVRDDIYEDRKGNRYYIKTNNRMTWESRDGRRVINLEKSNIQNRRGRSYDDYEYGYDYENRRRRSNGNRGNGRRFNQHICSSACGTTCGMGVGYRDDGMSGTWTNRWRNVVAYVEFDGYSVRMRTNNSKKWTTYRRTNSRKLHFEDRWGNRLRFKNNGRLQWRRADGRRNIDLTRDY
ncbi:hypothetical protein [Portibacter marinus]|uniref:hypothetical protein n=1 Tax=Portibacter marinus TaxID=2898660 RepID=UPI001F44EC12|nr:hypothetical protein [Portibacter marinus]